MLQVHIISLQHLGPGVFCMEEPRAGATEAAFALHGFESVPQAPHGHGWGYRGVHAPAAPEDGALQGSVRWCKWDAQEVKTSLALSCAGAMMPLGVQPLAGGEGGELGASEPATSCVTRSEHQREMPERSNNPR